VTADAGTARTETERPAAAIGDLRLDETADTKGFLGALFDFGFTSFVTPKVVKVLYVLIVIGTVVSALVSTIINLAHSLKLNAVAEGVETQEQSRLLRVLNCDEMQGYLFSKPLPRDVFESKYLRVSNGKLGPRDDASRSEG